MASPDPLRRLFSLDKSSPQFHDQVTDILYGKGYEGWVDRVEGRDVVKLVDYLDGALDSLDPASKGFRKCMRELKRICGERFILPTSYTISSQSLTIDAVPIDAGGFGDIYKGELDGLTVCAKRVKVYSTDGSQKGKKTLYQEAIMWRHLDHKNIVPLLGITTVPLQLVSKWMPDGNLMEYIGKHTDANRHDLLSDIAEGLRFLHFRNIIHGDLKGPNILIDGGGRARIADFGLATVTRNFDSAWSPSDDRGHTVRWAAPEVLVGESFTTATDIFSFAMVMIEVFTGAPPFIQNQPTTVICWTIQGKRPSRPTHTQFTNDLWDLMQRCWNHDPNLRPEISKILEDLNATDPLATKHGAASSTPTSGRQPLPALQLPSQRLGRSSLPSSTNHRGSTGTHEEQRPEPRGGSQVMPRDPVPRVDDRRANQQRDQPGGLIDRRSSSSDGSTRGPPVLAIADPPPSDPSGPSNPLVSQPGDHVDEAGKPHTNLKDGIGDRNESRKDTGDRNPSRSLDHGSEVDGEGKQRHEEQDRHSASRSGLNTDGVHKSGSDKSGSRVDPPKTLPQEPLPARYDQPGTNLHNKGKSTGAHGSPQATAQDPPSGVGHHHPDEGHGQPGGNLDRRSSRKDKARSKHPAPLLVDSHPLNNDEPQNLQDGRVNACTGSRAGMSHTNSRGTIGDGNTSRKSVSRKGSRVNQGDNNEGRYWVRDNHGASRSVPNFRDGHNAGGTSRNPSRADFSALRDNLARQSPSKTNLDHTGKSRSRVNFEDTGKETPLNELPKKDPRAPDREPSLGTKSRHQPRVNVGEARSENEGRPPPGQVSPVPKVGGTIPPERETSDPLGSTIVAQEHTSFTHSSHPTTTGSSLYRSTDKGPSSVSGFTGDVTRESTRPPTPHQREDPGKKGPIARLQTEKGSQVESRTFESAQPDQRQVNRSKDHPQVVGESPPRDSQRVDGPAPAQKMTMAPTGIDQRPPVEPEKPWWRCCC